jgi:hypothetical protein
VKVQFDLGPPQALREPIKLRIAQVRVQSLGLIPSEALQEPPGLQVAHELIPVWPVALASKQRPP